MISQTSQPTAKRQFYDVVSDVRSALEVELRQSASEKQNNAAKGLEHLSGLTSFFVRLTVDQKLNKNERLEVYAKILQYSEKTPKMIARALGKNIDEILQPKLDGKPNPFIPLLKELAEAQQEIRGILESEGYKSIPPQGKSYFVPNPIAAALAIVSIGTSAAFFSGKTDEEKTPAAQIGAGFASLAVAAVAGYAAKHFGKTSFQKPWSEKLSQANSEQKQR